MVDQDDKTIQLSHSKEIKYQPGIKRVFQYPDPKKYRIRNNYFRFGKRFGTKERRKKSSKIVGTTFMSFYILV